MSLLGVLLAKSDEVFYQTFDKVKLQQRIAEAESSTVNGTENQEEFSLETYISSFWVDLEENFQSEYLSPNIVEIFHQEI